MRNDRDLYDQLDEPDDTQTVERQSWQRANHIVSYGLQKAPPSLTGLSSSAVK